MNLTIRSLKKKRKRVKKMPQYFQSERVKYLKAITAHIKQLQKERENKLAKEGLLRTYVKEVKNIKPKSFYKTGVMKAKLTHQYVKHRAIQRLSARTGG
jgi:hypothetical protein